MRRIDGRWRCGVVMALWLAGASPAHAQASRTWVSGVGDDANPCSRTAPCKTFAGAISKTVAGGEINVLDPGGFGAVTITKSIVIDGGGILAGVLVSGTNGIVVNAGPADRVVLRGLDINGFGTGVNGVRFVAGGSLHVERCTIYRFSSGQGISFEGAGDLFVKDTTLRENAAGGISVAPASGSARATIDGVRSEANGFGVRIQGNTVATIHDSNASGNSGAGFLAETTPAQMTVEGSVAANNLNGVKASSGGIVLIGDVTVTNNSGQGLLAETGGQILSFKDNRIVGNVPDGKPTKKLSKR